MANAIFDNPTTQCREAWIDGKCISSVTYNMFMLKTGGYKSKYMPTNGHMRGDITALPEELRQYVTWVRREIL